MIHGLDTGFLVAAEVAEHASHADGNTKQVGNSSHARSEAKSRSWAGSWHDIR